MYMRSTRGLTFAAIKNNMIFQWAKLFVNACRHPIRPSFCKKLKNFWEFLGIFFIMALR